MKTTKILTILVLALCLIVCQAKVSEADPVPMGTAFTYQGHLYDNNDVADGEYDFQFKLYNDPCVGSQVGSDVNKPDVDVIDGYFTVELDFGTDIFAVYARWLEIGVRPGELSDSNAYTTLSPRQEVTPTPYALYAESAGGDGDWTISGSDMYSTVAGNVGIGTTSPAAKLEVNGQVKITGGSPGADKVLTSDGSGLASWQTLPAGGDITAVNAGTGLTGGGASGDVTLNVNVPLELTGSVASPGAIIKGINSGSGYGIHGEASGSQGRGVYGWATGSYGRGVYAYATGSQGTGVYGRAGNTGAVTNYGGFFSAAGSSGLGVYGEASNSGAGMNCGGWFSAAGSSGRGVCGVASNSGAITNYGGYFSAAGSSGDGVYSEASGSQGRGVYAYATGSQGTGVYGRAGNTGAVTNYGGFFSAAGSSGIGVYGYASASSGVNYGVYGHTESGSGYAGYFEGPVKATGKIEADQGVKMPLTYYEVMATTSTEQTVTTAVHNFCALTRVSLQTGEPGTFKYAEVVPNGDGTWTLKARGGDGTQDTVIAGCRCF